MAGVSNVTFAHNLTVGVAFRGLNLDVGSLGRVLETFVQQGSKRYRVTAGDIQLYCKPDEDPATITQNQTLEWFAERGNAIFDVLIFKSMASTEGVVKMPHNVDTWGDNDQLSVEEWAQAVFFQYFMILVRGSPSDSDSAVVGTSVPAILRNILSLDKTPKDYMDRCSTFNLNKVDSAWVKSIDITGLGVEVKNRLGLGVAGYRMFGPFKFLPKPPICDDNHADSQPWAVQTYEVVMSFINAGASWDVHPATRDPQMLARYGPLNANLGNFMIDIFPRASLTAMKDARVIYEVPVRNPAVTNYRTWSLHFTPSVGSLIM